METSTDRHAFVGAIAAEIDRMVVRGHEFAAAYTDKPQAVAELAANPALLSTVAIVLLKRSLSRDDIARIVPYTPRSLIDALIDNNVTEGVVTIDDDRITLTMAGRAAAEGVVAVQESAVADVWSDAADVVKDAERLLGTVVEHGRANGPLRSPSNFELFADVCDRPMSPGRVLRLITALRYWRADAHARALEHAGLEPHQAHALNCLWDAHRDVDRVGQGFPEPGRKGLASLESHGLADGGMITNDGIALREDIERATDRLTAPIYDGLDEPSQHEILGLLRTLAS